jgi:beta-galactosidase
VKGKSLSESLIDDKGTVAFSNLFVRRQNNRANYTFWLWSPRPLDDLLIEPDMPKLDILLTDDGGEIQLNGKKLDVYKTIPLKQGWNQLLVSVPGNNTDSGIQLICENNPAYIKQLQTSLQNPDR